MGGIIAFHLAWEYPQVFSMAGCLSPAFMIDDNEIVERVTSYSGSNKDIRLVILNGTEGLEAELQPAVDKMVQALQTKGYQTGKEFIYQIVKGAEHNEAAWAEQVPEVLLFFFGN